MVDHVIPRPKFSYRYRLAQTDPSPTADEVEPAPEPDNILALDDDDDDIQGVIKYLSSAGLSTLEVGSYVFGCVRFASSHLNGIKCSLMTHKKGEQNGETAGRLQTLTHLLSWKFLEVLGPSLAALKSSVFSTICVKVPLRKKKFATTIHTYKDQLFCVAEARPTIPR